MSRKLGFFETYSKAGYDLLAGDGVVITVALLSGSLEESPLRAALLALQKHHPLLQAMFGLDENGCDLFVLDQFASQDDSARSQALPLLVLERQHDLHYQEVFHSQSMVPVGSETSYLWRLVWLKGPQQHELILYSRHEITDATSTSYFLRDLLELYHAQSKGIADHPLMATMPLLPSAENLLPAKYVLVDQANAGAAEGPTVTWPYEGFCAPPERAPVYAFSPFDAETMAKLRTRCKAEQVTINSALSAAFFLAEFKVFQSGQANTAAAFRTAISLRSRCEPAISTDHLGTFAMTVGTRFETMGQQSFWDFCREVGTRLNEAIQAMEATGFLPQSFEKADVYQATKDAYQNTSTHHHFSDGPWISNLGLLPFHESIGEICLHAMYFGTKQVAGDAGAVLSIITLHGKMFCCLTTAAPLMSQATTRSILDKFSSILRVNVE